MSNLKNIKATAINYRKILQAMYEGTGNVYWLHKTEFDGQMKANFFTEFHNVKGELITFVNSGGVFKFPLINMGTKKPIPFVYNSII